ncbi:sensor domain-containing diguanylate cyclase [Photobacterium nomapromontoriensis]|uniref:sensor domain-containing diguanylate cyclase n=1 Tax=Photobacterium nomapromontoriensis TaxID=2910237 RepID=UPI003D14FD84
MLISNEDILTPDNVGSIFPSIINHIGGYLYVKNTKGEYIYANELICQLFNQPLANILHKRDSDFFPDPYLTEVLNNDQQVFQSKQPLVFNEQNTFSANQKLNVFKSVKAPIFNKDNEVIALYGISTDVTDIYDMILFLEAQANTDFLTNLPNRRYFIDQIERGISLANRHDKPLTIMSIDIDHFKQINDQYGHDVGDQMLVQFGRILDKNIRREDTAGRLGGDEFAIILPHTTLAVGREIAERVRQAVHNKIFNLSNNQINITLSIGIAALKPSDTGYKDLFLRVDKALYKAKENGRNQVEEL